MATETADRLEQLSAMLGGRGGTVVIGEFLMIGEKVWGGGDGREPRKDTVVHLNGGSGVLTVTYSKISDALDALGGEIPMAGTMVMLRVLVTAPAKDFVKFIGLRVS